MNQKSPDKMKTIKVFCGELCKSNKCDASEINLLHRDFNGISANITADFEKFLSDPEKLPAYIIDLLQIAAYVFCADRMAHRESRSSVYNDAWARSFEFKIPVKDYEFWKNPQISTVMCETLQFMTGDRKYVFDLSDLGKYLIAWYSQRPNISYGETKIFDKYFEILFKKTYKPEDIQALNNWMREVRKVWIDDNPLGFDEALLVMKAYAPYHQMYAVSMIFAISNNMADRVPAPSATWEAASKNGLTNELVTIAGQCLSTALENAVTQAAGQGRIFNPANWIKSKQCLTDINATIRPTFTALRLANKEVFEKLNTSLNISPENFEYRLQAD